MGKKGGARTKLTPELQEQLCKLLQVGITIEDACAEVGISDRVFHKWQARALERNERLYVQFFQAVVQAKARSKIRSVLRIDKAALKDWRADAWLLERRFPEEFGKRDQVKVHEAEKGEPFRPPGSHSKLLETLKKLSELDDEEEEDL